MSEDGSTPDVKPLYLFSDSQILFWRDGDDLFLERLRRRLPDDPRAAYIGASNGDKPEYYQIFEAAMDGIGISDRRMISSSFGAEDKEYLERADLILLAGGGVERGWKVIESTGMKEILVRRHAEGAVLAGVSAGAVQLGWLGFGGDVPKAGRLVDPLKLVPAIIGVHEEDDQWRDLRKLMRLSDVPIRGLGIPSGGGLIVHADQTVEPVRHPVVEVLEEEGRHKGTLLFPPDESIEVPEESEDGVSETPTTPKPSPVRRMSTEEVLEEMGGKWIVDVEGEDSVH